MSVGLSLTGLTLVLALLLTLAQSLRQQRSAQQRVRRQLRRSEQLEALGKLLDGLPHKIRNPLAVISFLALNTFL
ncbi:MAG: hypothetical protein CV088_04095 [Nitrospira sp. LK70]|nr:hypothetical protein [Nitrospira sp. LK70]